MLIKENISKEWTLTLPRSDDFLYGEGNKKDN